MNLVVDTNIIFSALIADGATRDIVIGEDLDLYAPEFFHTEFDAHVDEIQEKTGLDEAELETLLNLLFENIILVPRNDFADRLPRARELIKDIDPDDVPFVALALHVDAGVWSDDTDFQEQDVVKVWTTTELMEQL